MIEISWFEPVSDSEGQDDIVTVHVNSHSPSGKLFIVIFFSLIHQPSIIAAIVLGVTVLVLSLICAVVVVYRYTYMCRPR